MPTTLCELCELGCPERATPEALRRAAAVLGGVPLEDLLGCPEPAVRWTAALLADGGDRFRWRRVWEKTLLPPGGLVWSWAALACGDGGTRDSAEACGRAAACLVSREVIRNAELHTRAAPLLRGMAGSVQAATATKLGVPGAEGHRAQAEAAYREAFGGRGEGAAGVAIGRLTGRIHAGRRVRVTLSLGDLTNTTLGEAVFWAEFVDGAAGEPVLDPLGLGMTVLGERLLQSVSAAWTISDVGSLTRRQLVWGLEGVEGMPHVDPPQTAPTELRMAAALRSAATGAELWEGWGMPHAALTSDPLLTRYVRRLTGGSTEVRARAVRSMGDCGRAAVGPLLAAMGDPEAVVREEAAEALGRIGPDAHGAVEPLVVALTETRDVSVRVRCAAAEALGRIRSVAAVGPLTVALGDGGEGHEQMTTPDGGGPADAARGDRHGGEIRDSVSHAAALALGDFGAEATGAVGHLVALLKAANYSKRQAAAAALINIGPASAGPLVEALRDRDARQVAARTLVAIGATAVPALAVALSTEEEAALAAVEALAQIGADAVGPLTAALGSRAEPVRLGALEGLAAIGRDARAAVSPLIGALCADDRGPEERRLAARALGRIGPAAAAAVPHLAEALEGAEVTVSIAAAEALGGIGPAAVDAVEGLIAALAAEEDGVLRQARPTGRHRVPRGDNTGHALRRAAALALGRIGPAAARAADALVAALRDRDGSLGAVAATALGKLRAGARALVDALCGPSALEAEDALIEIGPAAAPLLVNALARPNERAWKAAARALGRLGPGAAIAIDCLLNRLRDPDCDLGVRVAAAHALGSIGPEATGPLLGALDVSDDLVRRAVVKALARAGRPAAPEAVGVLTALLVDGSWGVRQDAAEALGKMGPAAAGALAAAIGRCREDERLGIIRSLCGIGPGAAHAVVPVVSGSSGWDTYLRKMTAEALLMVGPAAIGVLRMYLRDDVPTVRRQAVNTLLRLGPLATDTLINALGDADRNVRRIAAEGLGQASPSGEAVAALTALLESPDDEMGCIAAESLGRLGPAAGNAVGPLARVLSGDGVSERLCMAVFALRRIGTPPAIAALHRALDHEQAEVARAAEEALRPQPKPQPGVEPGTWPELEAFRAKRVRTFGDQSRAEDDTF